MAKQQKHLAQLSRGNPVARHMYEGEHGWRPQTLIHRSGKKYSRKRKYRLPVVPNNVIECQ